MTTEEKALALVNETRGKVGLVFNVMLCQVEHDPVFKTLCRAIEAHEADKKAFSDAVKAAIEGCGHNGIMAGYIQAQFSPFILPEPEPDPLVEVLDEVRTAARYTNPESYADEVRQAIKARGGKIVWE